MKKFDKAVWWYGVASRAVRYIVTVGVCVSFIAAFLIFLAAFEYAAQEGLPKGISFFAPWYFVWALLVFLPFWIAECVVNYSLRRMELRLLSARLENECRDEGAIMKSLEMYIELIGEFLNREITVSEFEKTYLERYLSDLYPINDELYEPLEWLFSEVDCYTDLPIGPEDNPAFTIDEKQLRKSAAETLEKLRALK